MKREKRLTKRERKEQNGGGGGHDHHQHIHCIACGRHLHEPEFSATPPTALFITCNHGSRFPSCADCEVASRYLVAEHDRSGKPVNSVPAWH